MRFLTISDAFIADNIVGKLFRLVSPFARQNFSITVFDGRVMCDDPVSRLHYKTLKFIKPLTRYSRDYLSVMSIQNKHNEDRSCAGFAGELN